MYRRIVVPLDGSELAEVALPYAQGFAGRLGAEVVLIHVCESADEKHRRMHELYLQKIAEDTKRGIKKHMKKGQGEAKVRSAVVAGHSAEQIVDYADKEDADLIIIATHGRSGISRWVLGSVAAKVVRASTKPVALINAEGTAVKARRRGIMKRVLLPLDGSKESEAVIPHIEELAARFEAEVILLYVTSPTYFAYSIPGETVQMPFPPEDIERFKEKAAHYLETVVAAFKKRGIEAKAEVSVGAAAEEIMRMADDAKADIVAMSTHGRSGISRWAFGSTADKVLHAAKTPVLMVRAADTSKQ